MTELTIQQTILIIQFLIFLVVGYFFIKPKKETWQKLKKKQGLFYHFSSLANFLIMLRLIYVSFAYYRLQQNELVTIKQWNTIIFALNFLFLIDLICLKKVKEK